MIRKGRWAVAFVVGLGGCGQSGGAPEVAALNAEVAVTGGAAEVTERVPPVPSPVEQAPPEIADTSAGVGADTSAGVGVGVDAGVGVGVDAGVGVDSGASAGVDVSVSADGAAIVEAFAARIKERTPGCVGVTAEGRVVVSIVETGDATTLRLMDFEGEDAPEKVWSLASEVEATTALADAGFVGAVAGKTFLPCAMATGNGEVLAVPKEVPVQIKREAFQAFVSIEGNRPVKVVLRRDDDAAYRVAAAYYSEEVGAVYLRLVEGVEATLERVPALDLGNSSCVPRPVSGKPIVKPAPPPFEAQPSETSCVAMTADGKAAAFKTWTKANSDRGDDVPNKIVWAGDGVVPKVDLSCMARRCKPAEVEALQAAATAAGLVGCAPAKGAIAVDDLLVPFVYSKNLLRFQAGSGWRTVHELNVGSRTEAAESLWKAFQFPTGGPVFLYVGTEHLDETGVHVQVLDEAKMGLCAPSPRGVKVLEVKVGGALRDASRVLRTGAQLVDGDLTTGWISTAAKKGQSPWFELVLEGDQTVSGLELADGFQRRDGNGDGFVQYARAAEVVVTFADGTSETAKLEDVRKAQTITWAPRKTSSVKVTVAGMHPGTKYPGNVGVSEVRVLP